MRWHQSYRADPRARVLADRHYSRQTPGAAQFAPPGRCLVLLTEAADALWVSSWPYPQFTKHSWAKEDAWICSLFRNESEHRSSELIREAVAATRWWWGDPSPFGMITFVVPQRVRRKRDPGRCFRRAGFEPIGTTKTGLVVLRLAPEKMPAPEPPKWVQLPLCAET